MRQESDSFKGIEYDITPKMKAVRMYGYGHPDVLVYEMAPIPTLS